MLSRPKFFFLDLLGKTLLLLSSVMLFSVNAEQRSSSASNAKNTGFLYGIGVSVEREIYYGYGNRVIPIPVLGYQGENLSVLGPFINYKLSQRDNLSFSVSLSPRFQGFDEDDSWIFDGMASRKFSFDGGVAVDFDSENFKARLSAKTDILGRHNGNEFELRLAKTFSVGPIFIEPSALINYLDDKLIDYYYGVRDAEETNSRSRYQGSATTNYSLGLSISTPIFFNGFTRFNIEHQWYGTGISNSPLVERDRSWGVRLIYSRYF
ncbi:MipA/OmpV family protein [Thalassotalea ganghwensis]